MHPAFSTRGAQRRIVSNSLRPREPTCVIQVTVDADAVSLLRELVVRTCGAAFEYMRVAPCNEAGKVKAWPCIRPAVATLVARAVLRRLPAAEFGPVVHSTPLVPQ